MNKSDSELFPMESEILYDSIKVFINLNKTFLFVSQTHRFQLKQQQNLIFISEILQNTKSQIVQQCKTFMLKDSFNHLD